MKRKEFKVGFVICRAWCDVCEFDYKDFLNKFWDLKEDMIFGLQDCHDKMKPTACNGKLTIIFDNAVREI